MKEKDTTINGVDFIFTSDPARVGEINLDNYEPFAIAVHFTSAINDESYESALAKYHSGEYKFPLHKPTLWERIVEYFKFT